VLELIKIYILYIDHFSFEKVFVNASHENMDVTEFMKLCERLVNFELNFSNTISNAKMT
jgi:hypothetical protein